MVDMQNQGEILALEDFAAYIRNPVFMQFCSEIKKKYQCNEKIEFSRCSLERGWNVKFKKSGKSLCTIYPREGYFTVLVVIGTKVKEAVEAILCDCTPELRELYEKARWCNGQKWLMIDLEDQGEMFADVLRLIEIRRG